MISPYTADRLKDILLPILLVDIVFIKVPLQGIILHESFEGQQLNYDNTQAFAFDKHNNVVLEMHHFMKIQFARYQWNKSNGIIV